LYKSESPVAYTQGDKHAVTFNIREIDLSQVKRQVLLNVGLMRLEAMVGSESMLAINMVTHVSRDKEDDTKLNKTILNPLD
jgi:hypothetical protein